MSPEGDETRPVSLENASELRPQQTCWVARTSFSRHPLVDPVPFRPLGRLGSEPGALPDLLTRDDVRLTAVIRIHLGSGCVAVAD